jgi:hypothetical protein
MRWCNNLDDDLLVLPSNLVPEHKLGNQTLLLKNKYREKVVHDVQNKIYEL